MKLLIIGGSGFLGQHLTNVAFVRGHSVTHFNRGVTAAHPDPRVERIRGDRDGELSALSGRTWDLVVDTCGYYPWQVEALAEAMATGIGHFVFVSSVNQYRHFDRPGMDESGLSDTPLYARDTVLNPRTYGPLKAACEVEAMRRFPGRCTIVRPGYITGPHDPNRCFAYWASRVALGGRFLAPGLPTQPWQFIDVRDLAGWLIRVAEKRLCGIFNAVGPADPVSIGDVLGQMIESTSLRARPIWVDPIFLRASEFGAGLLNYASWVTRGRWTWLYALSSDRARSEGLVFRPITETMRDVLNAIVIGADEAPTNPRDQADEAGLIDDWWQSQQRMEASWIDQCEGRRYAHRSAPAPMSTVTG